MSVPSPSVPWRASGEFSTTPNAQAGPGWLTRAPSTLLQPLQGPSSLHSFLVSQMILASFLRFTLSPKCLLDQGRAHARCSEEWARKHPLTFSQQLTKPQPGADHSSTLSPDTSSPKASVQGQLCQPLLPMPTGGPFTEESCTY
jgi:hypothetical protein